VVFYWKKVGTNPIYFKKEKTGFVPNFCFKKSEKTNKMILEF